MAWIHGTRTYLDKVIEVEEVKSANAIRGGPKVTVGWRAKIVLNNVTIETAVMPTQNDAEVRMIRALNEWIDTGLPEGTK